MKLVNSVKNRLRSARGRKVWSLYIDLKSAFDSVTHKKLFSKMRGLGISNGLVNSVE